MNPSQSPIPTPAPQAAAGASPQDASQFGDYSDWAQGEMAKGFTADQLKQTLQQNNITLNAPSGGNTAATGGQQPSWWEKLLPTAGGILGSIVGVPLDFLGGAGSIAGAGIGGAAGQALENALTGKKVLQGNDLSSGIENAGGALLGGAAGKVVGALGEGITGAAAKAGSKVAEDAAQAAEQAGKLTDAKATQLNFGGLSPKLANELELGKGQQFVKSMGYDPTNPYDMEKVASGVNDLNNVYDRALKTAQPVKTDGLEQFFNNTAKTMESKQGGLSTGDISMLKKQGYSDEAIAKLTASNPGAAVPGSSVYTNLDPNSPVGQALADFNKIKGLPANAELPAEMNATDVRQLQQAVGRQIGNTHTIINNAELNGGYNVDAQNNLRTLQDLYGQLGDKVKTPEVNSAIAGYQVTPADRQGLITKYGEKLGGYLADTIGNAKTADDLLGPMQDLTKMSRASRMAINDIENVTNSPRAFAREEFKAKGGIMPSKASQGAGSAADLIEKAANVVNHPVSAVVQGGIKLHKAGFTPAIAKGIGSVLTRTAPLLTTAGVAASNIPNLSEPNAPGSAIPVPSAGTPQGGTTMNQGTPGLPASPVNSLIDTLLAQEKAAPTVLGPSLAPVLQSLAPTAQNNALAGSSLSELPATFNNAGGPQGLAGGLINSLLSHVPGTAANTYARQQQVVAAQIAKALGISPEAALAMLPQTAQTPGVAAPQVAGAGNLLTQLTAGLPGQ